MSKTKKIPTPQEEYEEKVAETVDMITAEDLVEQAGRLYASISTEKVYNHQGQYLRGQYCLKYPEPKAPKAIRW